LTWFGELGGKRVESEIGRVKSWSAFPISLFTLHFSRFPTFATLRDTLLPKLLSGDLSVVDACTEVAA
ncbi:MAG: hypothetical protein KDK99_11855, partial [Verrucomicrobiales bacterium]|nr:hypothetical protein [Verrucomicrobiales bacterium]